LGAGAGALAGDADWVAGPLACAGAGPGPAYGAKPAALASSVTPVFLAGAQTMVVGLSAVVLTTPWTVWVAGLMICA